MTIKFKEKHNKRFRRIVNLNNETVWNFKKSLFSVKLLQQNSKEKSLRNHLHNHFKRQLNSKNLSIMRLFSQIIKLKTTIDG